jgi:hypothetical protein
MMRSLERRSGCRLPLLCVAAAALCVVSMVATLVAVGKAPVRIRVELAGPGSITGQGSIQPLSPTAAEPARRPETGGDAPAPHGGTPQNRRAGGAPSTSMAALNASGSVGFYHRDFYL